MATHHYRCHTKTNNTGTQLRIRQDCSFEGFKKLSSSRGWRVEKGVHSPRSDRERKGTCKVMVQELKSRVALGETDLITFNR